MQYIKFETLKTLVWLSFQNKNIHYIDILIIQTEL